MRLGVPRNPERRRQIAIEYGRAHRKLDWDEITKQYVTCITPEESEEEGYLMVIQEDQEVQYDTVY